MLEQRLRCLVVVRGCEQHEGRPRFEACMIGEDAQTLYIYEGQQKELDEELEVGVRYTLVFQPFVNNRWVELKLVEAIREPV
jgi:hypothetical protein